MNCNQRLADVTEAVHAASVLEATIRFVLWAQQHRKPPTHEAIEEKFGVSRATAYRWLAAYFDATGTHRERHSHGFQPGKRQKQATNGTSHEEEQHPR